jgi:hypothetical protein
MSGELINKTYTGEDADVAAIAGTVFTAEAQQAYAAAQGGE